MYFIVPFLFLVIIIWVVLILITGGTLALSGDKPVSPAIPEMGVLPPEQEPIQENKVKENYLVIQGQKFKLTPAEAKKAKKDGYTVIME